MALTALNTLQRAAQSSFGTAVTTATAKLQNVSSFSLSPDLKTRKLERLIGSLAPAHATALDAYGSNATFEVSDESFEDVNYWLDSMFSAATPAGGGPYTRAYAAPLTAAATPKFMTLQYGQTLSGIKSVWQMQDASLTTLSVSGANNMGVQVGGSLVGGKVVEGSLQTLSDRTGTTRMTGCMAGLKIDTWAGTMGTTAVTTSAFSWEVTWNANREYRGYLGDCVPTAWDDQRWGGQLKLSLELNGTTDDYLASIFATSNAILEHQIQILYKTGSGATERIFKIQFAGHTMSAPQLFQDRNGIVTYDLVYDGVYHPTFANWLKIDTSSRINVLV